MPQELQAGPVTLLQLLKGEREYVSPLFQRQYVWGSKEIGQLWKDVDEILDGAESTRFLGALVLEVKTAGLAFQPDSTWIVDGQQRLTTLYLALLKIAQQADRAGATELSTTICRQYLFNQDGEFRDRPKLLPTLLDYKQFNNLFDGLQSVHPRLQPAFGDESGALAKASRSILTAVRERISVDKVFDEGKAKALVAALLEKLKFVQIVLGDSQDPHQVFDSLNAQGVRLDNKDLIRNIVFQRLAGSPNEAEVLYRSKWVPLEQDLGTRFDSYFFPFALVHQPTVTKSTLLAALRDKWTPLTPNQIVEDLRTYVPVFNALTSEDATSRDTITESQEINDQIWRLYRMGAPTSLYPFILSVVTAYRNGQLTLDWTRRNLLQIEGFLVRRALAGFEPTGLHAVFKDLWTKTAGDPDKFIQEIDRNPTVQFPDDVQFRRDILERPLYGRRLAKYILAEYERGLRGGDPFPDVEPTIDHVMPQELTEAWKEVVTTDDHKALKDTWANLVPLSGPANAEKGRKPWPDVRKYFETETVFKTTKRLAQQNETWTSAEIRARAEQLVLWAIERWPKGTAAT
ncbi:MAG: DUF262 domain-containing HNH endonuclease family protein [Dehalococcoidia bacterium]